jgi:menaquinone-dependent protoporphyrinogen oxidase
MALMARRAESERSSSDGKPVGVLYATREGQTRRISGHIARALRDHGFLVDLGDVADHAGFNLSNYSAVILAAPVHAGRHSSQMVKFVQRYRTDLDRLPSAFISVTLSEAGVERTDTTPQERARFAADVQKVIDEFVKETGWHAKYVKPVAGALKYTKYNFLIRRIMKGIATKVHAETDTSRDCEYTNWPQLDSWVTEFSAELRRQESLRQAS